jgi:hypothetical protein
MQLGDVCALFYKSLQRSLGVKEGRRVVLCTDCLSLPFEFEVWQQN